VKKKTIDTGNGGNKAEVLGKVPPQDVEAEQCLLGSIFISNRAFDDVAHIVREDDFYDPRHAKIFRIMKELNNDGKAIDLITVTGTAKDKNLSEGIGGASYSSSLADSVPTPAHAGEYAKRVRDKAILRNLIEISTKTIEEAYKSGREPVSILEQAQNGIFGLAEDRQKTSIQTIGDLVGPMFKMIEHLEKREERLTGLETGFNRIDDYTSGLQDSELIIIAARPSLGKTSLALNMAYNLGVKNGKNILIFSFEMGTMDLMRRFLSYGSRISMQKIRTGKMISQSEKSRMLDILGRMSSANVLFDVENNSVFEMRSKARALSSRLKRQEKKLDLIIVDYIQLVKPGDNIPREQQIAQISRSLKALAIEMQVPVVALSQLNREVDKTRGEKGGGPKLSNLRESGALEQDADVVLFIDREDDKEMEGTVSEPGKGDQKIKVRKCKLIIAKNRNGPIGDQSVYFVPDYTSFEQISYQQEEPEAVSYDNEKF